MIGDAMVSSGSASDSISIACPVLSLSSRSSTSSSSSPPERSWPSSAALRRPLLSTHSLRLSHCPFVERHHPSEEFPSTSSIRPRTMRLRGTAYARYGLAGGFEHRG